MTPEAPFVFSIAALSVTHRRMRAFVGEFAPAEWRVSLDRAVEYRRADGNVGDKEKDRLTRIRL